MKNLIVIAHPDKNSFCYNGIYKTILQTLNVESEEIRVADLYADNFERPRTDIINRYKEDVTWSDRIYFVSPVWWFRLTPRMEVFFDEVFSPGFAYKFVPIIGKYAYPKPFLKDKIVRTYITHGAPALPVLTLYLNSVKLRLVMGVYTFVFGWSPQRWLKTKQFWSVPFVNDKTRAKYLGRVKKDVLKDIKKG
jgi:NAD(P)H dehydrogenase (quinone)